MAAILHSRNWALLAAPIRFTLTNVFSSAQELIFYKQEDGDVVPGSIIINTTVSANLTNPSYKWEYATSNNPTNWITITGQTGSSLTVSGTVFESTYLNFGANGDSINFRVTASQTGRVSSVSETTIKYYNEASDTIQLVLDKPSITIMCDQAGVPNLLNTNNALRVSANGRLLNYDTAGPSTFSVDSITVDPANSLTIAGQGLGSIYTINNLQGIDSNVSSLLFTVTLNVTVRNTKGNPREPRSISYTYVKVVPATDGTDAVTLDLLSDTDVVFANNAGLGYTLPTGNEAKLYEGNTEVPDGPTTYYGIEIVNPQDPNTKVIVPSTTVGGLTASIDDNTGVISLTGTNWTNTQQSFTFIGTYKNKTYRKIYSISKSVSGYDNIALDLYTEASVVIADDKGNNYTLPTQNNYAKLYKGGSIIASGVQYSTTTPSIDGLSVTVDQNTGQITLGPANNGWTGNSANIVVKATYAGVEYTKIYNLTKSKKGDPTVIVNLIRNNDIVPSLTDGTNYELPTANNNRIRLYRGGGEITTGITYGPASSSSNGLTAIVSSSGQITLVGNSNSWNQKIAEFEFNATYEQVNYSVGYTITKSLKGVEGAPGADAITVDLYSESDVVAADEFGKNYTNTLPTNYIKLYKGGVELTNAANGVTYGLAGTSVGNGLVASVNSTTGAISLNGANNIWTGDNAFFDFTATYNSKTYTASYSIAKSKRGSSTVFIDLYSEQHVIAADSNGGNYSLPTNNYVKLYRGGELITGAVYGPAVQVTQNGLSLSVDSSTGLISLSGANWSTDQEIFTITAKPSATDTNEFTTQYKITKTRSGSAGIPAFNGALTNESYNVPVSSSGIVSPSGVITNAGGLFDLKNGATSLNSVATFSIIGGTDNGNNWTKTQNNVKLTIVESGVGAGTYTVEVIGGNWTTSVETFTLRGTYGANYIDRVYIIGKDPGTEAVSLTTTKQSFSYTSAGALVSGQGTATITATLTGYTGTAYYEFIVDNSTLQNTTTSTYTYTPQSTYSNMPDQVSVKVREGSASGAVLATDTISMFGVPQGVPGTDGKVVYNGVIYKQQTAQPTAPSGGNFNALTGVLTPPSGWTISKPTTTTTPTWASEYLFVVTAGTTTNTGGTWGTPFIDAQSGTDGSANERVELYITTADGSTPTAPTSVTYTITGSVLGAGAGSWSLTMPAVPTYPGAVFMTTAVASSNTPGTAITLTGWTTPVMVARNGAPGAPGASGKVVYNGVVYKQQSTQPTAPTGGNFNAASATLTAPSGWSISKPTTTTTPTWASEFVFNVDAGSTTNPGGTWSTPFIDAQSGTDGSANERVELYQATSNGSTPTAPTSVTYTITGSVLGAGAGSWSLTMPAVPTYPGAVFMTTAVASSNTPGTAITLTGWTAPVMVARNGAPGYTPVKGVDYFDGVNGTSVDIQYSANSTGPWSDTPVPGTTKWVRTGTKVPPATSFTYAPAVKFVPELGVEYTVTNGVSSYIHVKYSDNGGSSFTYPDGETPGDWMGILVDTNVADSTNPAAYTWQYVKGPQGVGTPGTPGDKTAKVYIKTADQATVPGAPTGTDTAPGGSWSTSPVAVTGVEAQWESDGRGVWNGSSYTWSWSSPYLSYFKVNTLEAITTNTGNLNVSGNIVAGTTPAISGSAMSGSGAIIYSTGSFGFGNSSRYLTWNGSTITLNGDIITNGIGVFAGSNAAAGWGNCNLRCGTLNLNSNPGSTTTYGLISIGSARGVVGVADGGGSQDYGVFGQAFGTNSVGVIGYGDSSGGIGIKGSGNAHGVRGDSPGEGVYGSGATGVKGVTTSSSGSAVAGVVSDNTGTAIYAQTPSCTTSVGTSTYSLYGTGNITVNGNVIAGASDIRLKTNITGITGALEKVLKLSAFTYTYNDLAKSYGLTTTEKFVGLSAQDVETVLPEAVKRASFDINIETGNSKTGHDYKALQYDRIVPLLVEAIKELKQELDRLKQKVGS